MPPRRSPPRGATARLLTLAKRHEATAPSRPRAALRLSGPQAARSQHARERGGGWERGRRRRRRPRWRGGALTVRRAAEAGEQSGNELHESPSRISLAHRESRLHHLRPGTCLRRTRRWADAPETPHASPGGGPRPRAAQPGASARREELRHRRQQAETRRATRARAETTRLLRPEAGGAICWVRLMRIAAQCSRHGFGPFGGVPPQQ